MKLRVFLFLAVFLSMFALNVDSAQAAKKLTCSSLFETPPKLSYREIILNDALFQARIKSVLSHEETLKLLKQWDINDSRPAMMEAVAQSVVLKLTKRRTFTQWIKDIVFKGDPIKEALRVRAQTLILKRELLDQLDLRKLLVKDTRYEKYKELNAKYFNRIKLARLLAVNAVSFYFTGAPFYFYFPSFNWTKNLELTDGDLDLIVMKGFDKAYPGIIEKYNKELKLQRGAAYLPHAIFVSVASAIAYNYFNFRAVEGHFDVEAPQSQKSSLYIEWERQFIEKNGRPPDLSNLQDKKEWDIVLDPFYLVWVESFKITNGRDPDLLKEEDQQDWEAFLSSVQAK